MRLPLRKSKTEKVVARHFETYPQEARILVHIGKCGGSTFSAAVRQSRFKDHFHQIHVEKPPFRHDFTYVILLRNPLSRAVSAFNWRRRLLLEDGRKPGRPEELKVFERFATANQAAEALYSDDWEPDPEAHHLMSLVGHIRKGIPFYLTDLLKSCRPDQIERVVLQECLDEDIETFLHIEPPEKLKFNSGTGWRKHLSEKGARNLRRFLFEDYLAIMTLRTFGKLDDRRLALLMD